MSIKRQTNNKQKLRRRELYLKHKIQKQNRSRNKINYDYKWRGILEQDHDILIKEQFDSCKEEEDISHEEYKRFLNIYMDIIKEIRKELEENDSFDDMYDIAVQQKVRQIWLQERREKHRKLCLHYK